MIFKTASDSLYEVDRENTRIRRLSGVGTPTQRMGGTDNVWKECEFISDVVVGARVVFQVKGAVPDTEGAVPGTLTTVVKEIFNPD